MTQTRLSSFLPSENAKEIQMYVRFQTGMRCRDTGRSLGIFRAAGRLEDEGRVENYLTDSLTETLSWFNKNLPVPKNDTIDPRCLFWFVYDNPQSMSKIWDLVTWLRVCDVFVAEIKCADPGKIYYRDELQVAARPSVRVMRRLKL